jgi:molybdate-binding protein
MKLIDLPKKNTQDTVTILEEWLAQAKNGEFENVSLIAFRTDRSWQTGASSTTDNLRDSAMLIELAIRRMGFVMKGGV